MAEAVGVGMRVKVELDGGDQASSYVGLAGAWGYSLIVGSDVPPVAATRMRGGMQTQTLKFQRRYNRQITMRSASMN